MRKCRIDECGVGYRDAGGAEVQAHVVFVGNELDTIERISAEEDGDAVLIPRPVERLERTLVPLRGLQLAEHIAHFVTDLMQDGTTDVMLLHMFEEDAGDEADTKM